MRTFAPKLSIPTPIASNIITAIMASGTKSPTSKIRSKQAAGGQVPDVRTATHTKRSNLDTIAILCSDLHLSHRPPLARSNIPDWYKQGLEEYIVDELPKDIIKVWLLNQDFIPEQSQFPTTPTSAVPGFSSTFPQYLLYLAKNNIAG